MIPPFIYSVGPGNQFILSDPNVFFVLFFVVDSFRSPCHLEGKKHQGDSTHVNKQIGLFTAKEMKACIDEIKEVKQRAKDQGRNLNSVRNTA